MCVLSASLAITRTDIHSRVSGGLTTSTTTITFCECLLTTRVPIIIMAEMADERGSEIVGQIVQREHSLGTDFGPRLYILPL